MMGRRIVWVGLVALLLGTPGCQDETRREAEESMRSIGRTIEEALRDVSNVLDDFVEWIREVGAEVGDQVVDAADEAGDAADEALDAADEAIEKADEAIRER
jgi:gas vesicle protein